MFYKQIKINLKNKKIFKKKKYFGGHASWGPSKVCQWIYLLIILFYWQIFAINNIFYPFIILFLIVIMLLLMLLLSVVYLLVILFH